MRVLFFAVVLVCIGCIVDRIRVIPKQAAQMTCSLSQTTTTDVRSEVFEYAAGCAEDAIRQGRTDDAAACRCIASCTLIVDLQAVCLNKTCAVWLDCQSAPQKESP
jgi:hypothetical protein